MATPFFRYLDTAGDGTGTKNANGDYSITPDEFYFQPTLPCYVHRMLISIEDTTGIFAEEYGNLGAQLTNGWEVKVTDSSDIVQHDLTDGVAIKTNAQIGRACYDVDLKSWGAGNELLVARWSFDKAGAPIHMDANDKFVITFNDNLSGLITHYFNLQGVWD